jgi:DNA-binding transcriptional MerR regulator
MAYGDDPHRAELMTAGQFGRQTLLSAKALRIYAERGLLRPHFVDPINGYRYYAAEQVPTGWLISLLRSADLSLEQIRQIIGTDPESALQQIKQAAVAIERRSQAVQAVLQQARLRLLQEVIMTHITTTLEGDRPVLSVMKRMRPQDMDDIITTTVDRLRQLAAAAALTVTGDPFGVFHAPITAPMARWRSPYRLMILQTRTMTYEATDSRAGSWPTDSRKDRRPPSPKSLDSTMSCTVGSPTPAGCRSGHRGRPGTTRQQAPSRSG